VLALAGTNLAQVQSATNKALLQQLGKSIRQSNRPSLDRSPKMASTDKLLSNKKKAFLNKK